MEILSPAGNLEKLKYAYAYGADAVYCAGNNFSLRSMTDNFSKSDLIKARKLSEKLGKKLYIAVNIFAHNRDILPIKRYLLFLQSLKPDALIIADPAIFGMVKELVPKINIHISTQANITSYKSAEFWYKQGATRVILARELSIQEIRMIKKKLPLLELEVFVHGAMCIAYSGRCLLSSFLNDRDANAGKCTQVCRWGFAIAEKKRKGSYYDLIEDNYGSYILNSKDLCLIDYIQKLKSIGVDSIKIEGRMKSIYYVANTTRVYKNSLQKSSKPDLLQEELNKISHRVYTDGFIKKISLDTQNYQSSSYIRDYQFIGTIIKQNSKEIFVHIRSKFVLGDTLEIIFPQIDQDIEYKVQQILDKSGKLLTLTKPNTTIKLPIQDKLPPNGIIRKKL